MIKQWFYVGERGHKLKESPSLMACQSLWTKEAKWTFPKAAKLTTIVLTSRQLLLA